MLFHHLRAQLGNVVFNALTLLQWDTSICNSVPVCVQVQPLYWWRTFGRQKKEVAALIALRLGLSNACRIMQRLMNIAGQMLHPCYRDGLVRVLRFWVTHHSLGFLKLRQCQACFFRTLNDDYLTVHLRPKGVVIVPI